MNNLSIAAHPLEKLADFDQCVWCDELSRELLQQGEIDRMIAEWNLSGVTSNPTIFQKAISESEAYSSEIKRVGGRVSTAGDLLEELMLVDIAETADRFLPLHKNSSGERGFVSIEVSPGLAFDTEGTIEEAIRLRERLNRPNVMIKVPGTEQGLPAIFELLKRGIHVNVTLLFSVEMYRRVAETYCNAMEARREAGTAPGEVRSVASFFVSRVDTKVDDALEQKAQTFLEQGDQSKAKFALSLKGKAGVSNCKIAYREFQDVFLGRSFRELTAVGAAVQRPLWASTSVKSESYRDVMYVEELIGPHTVSTMPIKTLSAFADHGRAEKNKLLEGIDEAEGVISSLGDLGIELDAITADLLNEGVDKFSASYNETIELLEKSIRPQRFSSG